MQFISAHNGKIQTLSAAAKGIEGGSSTRTFHTGLEPLDALMPKQSLARGAVHELLFHPRDTQPNFIAALFAHAAAFPPLPPGFPCTHGRWKGRGEGAYGVENGSSFTRPLTLTCRPQVFSQRERGPEARPIIWSDPHREMYPPALAALGFDLSNIYLLRPQSPRDESWAITECLRCRGVGAVIAAPQKISCIEARRFQLAAERGGGVGIFLRPTGRGDSIYAAATRWLVTPHPGERTIQRWTIQLLHGHGGRVGQTVILEQSRENHSVRALEKLADRQIAPPAAARIAS